MLIRIHITITDLASTTLVHASKEYNSGIIPHTGDMISAVGLGNGSHIIGAVSIDYDLDVCHVSLDNMNIRTEDFDTLLRDLNTHKWSVFEPLEL